jgi:hypothetical protein
MSKQNSLVIRVSNGEVREKAVMKGSPEIVVKDVITSSLPKWDPRKSDLLVSKYDLGSDDRVRVYIISFKGEWRGDNYVESEVLAVMPYAGDDAYVEEVIDSLREYTKTG